MVVESENQPKIRWGELEDDAEDLDFLLPPKQVIGLDQNGVKKVIEYKFNEEGNKVKITTTTRIRKLVNARLSKGVVERRSWPKFGDVVHEDVGARLTMVSIEEIIFEHSRAPNGRISFPKPVYPLVHPAVLVKTFEQGECVSYYVNELEGHARLKSALAHIGTHALLKMLLVDNFIHADMHPGNILVQVTQSKSSRK